MRLRDLQNVSRQDDQPPVFQNMENTPAAQCDYALAVLKSSDSQVVSTMAFLSLFASAIRLYGTKAHHVTLRAAARGCLTALEALRQEIFS